MKMIVLQDTPAATSTEADTALSLAESTAAAPSWWLIIVMGIALMIASRPRRKREPLSDQ